MRSRSRSLPLVLVLLVAAGPLAAQTLDRFYLDLLQTGSQELDRADAAAAARDLRLACFGLLDSPPTLAGCLARLGLAQAALGDDAGFNDSFRRLAEVEERFAGFSQADLSQPLRERYIDEALRRVKDSRLRSLPAFAALLDQRQEAELARLSVRERRKAIEARIAADPASRHWRVALAVLELDDQRPKAALKPLEPVLKSTPDDGEALCLRGRAQAALDDCADALAGLRACALGDSRGVAARLACLVDQHQEAAAAQLAQTLPPATRSDPGVAKLLARLPPATPPASRTTTLASPPKPKATPSPEPAPQTAKPAPPASPSATPPAAAHADPPAPPASVPADLEEIRRRMERARTVADVEATWQAASGLADRYPASADAQFLAAEVAYRARRWVDADRYFRRGGDPGESRPLLLFYAAVVAHETGDAARAQATLRRALPLIQRTPYVDLYVQKILGSSSGP